jgi:hypothetical protein
VLAFERDTDPKYGGGKDGHTFTLLLHDMHGEYTGDFDKRLPDMPYGECEVIWKTSGVIDTFQEVRGIDADQAERAAATMMRDYLPAPFVTAHGGDSAYIEWVWKLTGSKEYLDAKFQQLWDALNVETVSGDDDAFDYWPNTMDMLWDFAKDLDDIFDNEDHKARVWDLAKRVFEGTVGPPNEKDYSNRKELFTGEWGLDREDRSRGWNYWMIAEGR